jgi:putative membrane protein insertion efficiency factor
VGFRAFSAVVLVVLVAAAWNAQTIALGGIHAYQRALAPAAARAGLRCRFTPTCSRYAEVVIARDGVVRGGINAIARIARCGPWTPPGTRDDP